MRPNLPVTFLHSLHFIYPDIRCINVWPKGKYEQRTIVNSLYLLEINRYICSSEHEESPSGRCCSPEWQQHGWDHIWVVATGWSMLQSLPSTTTTSVFPAPGEPHSRVPTLSYFQRQADLVPVLAPPPPKKPSTVKTEGQAASGSTCRIQSADQII